MLFCLCRTAHTNLAHSAATVTVEYTGCINRLAPRFRTSEAVGVDGDVALPPRKPSWHRDRHGTRAGPSALAGGPAVSTAAVAARAGRRGPWGAASRVHLSASTSAARRDQHRRRAPDAPSAQTAGSQPWRDSVSYLRNSQAVRRGGAGLHAALHHSPCARRRFPPAARLIS
jgi:hypothetical protein